MRLCLVPRAQVWLEVAGGAFLVLLILPSPPVASWFLVHLLLPVLKSCCVLPQKMVMDSSISSVFFRTDAGLSLFHPHTRMCVCVHACAGICASSHLFLLTYTGKLVY